MFNDEKSLPEENTQVYALNLDKIGKEQHMKFLIILLSFMSCATRGLQLSEQIPSMHPDYNNPNVLGFVEEKKDLKLDNIYFANEKSKNFVKDYLNNKRVNRAVASEKFKSAFKKTNVTIEPLGIGILLNN